VAGPHCYSPRSPLAASGRCRQQHHRQQHGRYDRGRRQCTLREAIQNSNSDHDTTGGDCAAGNGIDTINFSVTGTIP